MLYHFIHISLSLSPFIYHSCPSFLASSILHVFPRPISDYEELTLSLLQIVTLKCTPLSYGEPSRLLCGRLYPSHTVEQTVRLNRSKKNRKERWWSRKHALRRKDFISASPSVMKGRKKKNEKKKDLLLLTME